jgi:hypothetical protein
VANKAYQQSDERSFLIRSIPLGADADEDAVDDKDLGFEDGEDVEGEEDDEVDETDEDLEDDDGGDASDDTNETTDPRSEPGKPI